MAALPRPFHYLTPISPSSAAPGASSSSGQAPSGSSQRQNSSWRDGDRSLELAEGGYEPKIEEVEEDEYASESSGLFSRTWSRNARNRHRHSLLSSCLGRVRKSSTLSRKGRWVLYAILAVLAALGLVQLVTLALKAFVSFFPSDFEEIIDRWGQPGQPGQYLNHWPTDITGGVMPIPCHSHNDYWRPVPLFSALEAGCISVEADIWFFDDDLFVGHTTASLAPNRTLTSLYIDPLVQILEKQNPITRFHPTPGNPPNGVFDTKPSQSIVLLIDFKNKAADAWPYVISQLSPLRDRGYLTYFDGKNVTERPVTVVATGNAPFDLLTANDTYRDVFYDAPLERMMILDDNMDNTTPSDGNPPGDEDLHPDLSDLNTIRSRRRLLKRSPHEAEPPSSPDSPPSTAGNKKKKRPKDPSLYNTTNSYYASVSFRKSIEFPWQFGLSRNQMDRLRAQIRGAHKRGLKVRYWGIPSWPRGLRNYLWTVLVKEGVDMLNVDDLRSAASRDWAGWK